MKQYFFGLLVCNGVCALFPTGKSRKVLDRSTYYVIDRSMLLSRFSTHFVYQYGISGCKLQMRTGSQTAWFVVFGSRISSSFTEQNLSRTLLLQEPISPGYCWYQHLFFYLFLSPLGRNQII